MNLSLFSRLSLVVAVALAGCGKKHVEDEESTGSTTTPVVAVKTSIISRGTIDLVVSATGKTDAIRKEKIFSPIGGTIIALRVLEGMPVRRGDVLAVVQPRETRATIVGAESLVRSARSDEERREARRALELARSSQNNIDVRATFDGTVATRNVTEGELITDNGELMTLVDLSTITFVADVPLHDVQHVRAGEKATVVFPSLPARSLEAVVEAVNPHSDQLSQSVKVRLQFRNIPETTRPLLKTEMSGVARIVTGTHDGVLVVPKPAVLRDDEKNSYSVVVATHDSLAHIVPVTIGARTDSTAEVHGEGLSGGMSVVIEGNYALADSTRIAPVR